MKSLRKFHPLSDGNEAFVLFQEPRFAALYYVYHTPSVNDNLFLIGLNIINDRLSTLFCLSTELYYPEVKT